VLRIATFTALIRGDPLPWLEREVALLAYLSSVGASVMPPSDLVPPGPHVVDGWSMSAWAFVEHERGVEPDPPTVLRALDDLHAAMRGYPGELPLLNPVDDDLERVLRFAVGRDVMTAADARAVRERRDGLVARLLSLAPDIQAQHGDAFSRNSLATRRGVVWIDFEDCCSAPVLWDLAAMIRSRPDDAVRAIVVERHGTAALAAAIALRQLQVDAWTVLHDARARLGW
jgi:Phosphotransferase enzyme family